MAWRLAWGRGPRGYIYAPPVYAAPVYAPPPRVYYAPPPPVVYAPPPVVFAPPFISLGIGIR